MNANRKGRGIRRRDFLKITGLAGVGLAFWPRRGFPFLQTPVGISKFTIPLPQLGPLGIPVSTPDKTAYAGADFHRLVAGEFKHLFHPDFLNIYGTGFPGTTCWGYASDNPVDYLGGAPNHRYLGGLIVAAKNRPVRMQMRNNLVDGLGNPLPNLLAPDPTLMDSPQEVALENRISIHLHGGHVPWISDGGPFAWFSTPDPATGIAPTAMSYVNVPDMPAPPEGSMTFYYPNDQTSRLMWYHDHAHGLTRINAYAGLVTGYLVQDQAEFNLVNAGFIPPMSRMVPLILQDKSFVPVGGNTEPAGRGNPGDLWYPSRYEGPPLAAFGASAPYPPVGVDSGRWDLTAATEPTPPSAIPEFFADIALVNGACFPFMEVEARRYRFRILNGCNARFLNLQLYYADPANPTEIPVIPDNPANPLWMVPDPTKVTAGPKIIQIGNEGGFLPFPVELNNPPAPFTAQLDAMGAVIPSTLNYTLLLAPAERADVVIDFGKCPIGSKLILYNDAPGPFPNGDPRSDYYTGAPDYSTVGGAPTPGAGMGPNTRTMMQFRVKPRVGAADPPMMALLEAKAVKGLRAPVPALGSILPSRGNIDPATAVQPYRRLGLFEDFDALGRLRQLLGPISGPLGMMQGPCEMVQAGTTEVWEVYNITMDTHPIHIHLTNCQVLGRAAFVPDPVTGMPTFDGAGNPILAGPWRNPDTNERGYKETVRMNPLEVTRIIMTFDLPATPFAVPTSPMLGMPPFGVNAYEYVWHCHILEHEEHDMMHFMAVLP